MWRDDGCRDMAQWLSGRLGISQWIAARWVNASHAIPTLPLISQALESGRLCLDKVVELCRFATPESEQELIAWARRVSVAAVRHKADVACRPELEEVRTVERARFLRWWWNEGGASLGFEGLLPAAEGAAFVKALKRTAERLPESPTEETHLRHPALGSGQKRAALCRRPLCAVLPGDRSRPGCGPVNGRPAHHAREPGTGLCRDRGGPRASPRYRLPALL